MQIAVFNILPFRLEKPIHALKIGISGNFIP